MDPISHSKKLKVLTNLGPLSTHVLDTIKGSPAIGLGVSLYKLKDSRWTMLTERYAEYLSAWKYPKQF
jgi:5-hydroxyisourate hydrolase-like protein (transthyretin family)